MVDPGTLGEESLSSDSVPMEYEVDEVEPMNMEPDGDELDQPMEEDFEPDEMGAEDEFEDAESKLDSLDSDEELPNSSSSSKSSGSDPDRVP